MGLGSEMQAVFKSVRVLRFVNTKTVRVSIHYYMGGFAKLVYSIKGGATYTSLILAVRQSARDAPLDNPPACVQY